MYHRFREQGYTVTWYFLILATRSLRADHVKGPCPICFEDISEEGVHTTYGCSHSFHAECLRAWKCVRPDCPMCLAPL